MGTDIHIVVEEQTSSGWVAVNTLTEGFHLESGTLTNDLGPLAARVRNYPRFSALAAIRGDGKGRAARGFPEDTSDTVRTLYNRDAGHYHNASWMPMADAVQIFVETELDAIRNAMTDPAYVYFDVAADDIERTRIVFWFDN